MITAGITGRSGCGKSSVTEILTGMGYPMIDGDEQSRLLLKKGSPILAELQEAFGTDILDKDGNLKRRLLADRAFATGEGTERLNSITHPAIMANIREAMGQALREGKKLFFIDGAVIVGTPFEALCDRLVLVTVPREVSIQRICARDGISPEMAARRLDAQLPEKTLEEKADFILRNDGTREQLREKVRQMVLAMEQL